MKDDNRILSVGIDIGTTTTSMIVSRLAVENTAMVYMAPNVELTSKQIIYRSPVYLTPLLDQETLDGEEIKRIIEKEYASARRCRQRSGDYNRRVGAERKCQIDYR